MRLVATLSLFFLRFFLCAPTRPVVPLRTHFPPSPTSYRHGFEHAPSHARSAARRLRFPRRTVSGCFHTCARFGFACRQFLTTHSVTLSLHFGSRVFIFWFGAGLHALFARFAVAFRVADARGLARCHTCAPTPVLRVRVWVSPRGDVYLLDIFMVHRRLPRWTTRCYHRFARTPAAFSLRGARRRCTTSRTSLPHSSFSFRLNTRRRWAGRFYVGLPVAGGLPGYANSFLLRLVSTVCYVLWITRVCASLRTKTLLLQLCAHRRTSLVLPTPHASVCWDTRPSRRRARRFSLGAVILFRSCTPLALFRVATFAAVTGRPVLVCGFPGSCTRVSPHITLTHACARLVFAVRCRCPNICCLHLIIRDVRFAVLVCRHTGHFASLRDLCVRSTSHHRTGALPPRSSWVPFGRLVALPLHGTLY